MSVEAPGAGATRASVRCAQLTRDQQLDPIGSAPRYDHFLLVETPPPWPREIESTPAVRELVEAAAADPKYRLRVQFVSRGPRESHDAVTVVSYQRDDGRFAGYARREWHVAPDQVGSLGLAVLRDTTEAWDGARRAESSGQDLLLCNHGARDACCGSLGTRLHAELDRARSGGPVTVWRSSHLGGHRFAPTALSLPEGRYWGLLDEAALGGIIDRSADPASLTRYVRGSAAAPTSAGQVLERALFAELGWVWHDYTWSTACDDSGEPDGVGATSTVTIHYVAPDGSAGSATGVVRTRRVVPTPTCGLPADQTGTDESSPEYELVQWSGPTPGRHT
jgi:hypothetical protein